MSYTPAPLEELTRRGLVITTSFHGNLWVKSASNLADWREEIVVVPEDGEAIRGNLTIDALHCLAAQQPVGNMAQVPLFAVIRSMMDRTLKPCIVDSEGGWGRYGY